MKINPKKSGPFAPVEITLTIESQDELNGLWNVFNHNTIVRHLKLEGSPGCKIREALESFGAQPRVNFTEFVESLAP